MIVIVQDICGITEKGVCGIICDYGSYQRVSTSFDSISGFSDQGSGLYNGVIEALNMYLKAVAQFF